MKLPQFGSKAVFVFMLLACVYQLRDFRRTVEPFEQVIGRPIRGSGDGMSEFLGRFGLSYLYLGRSQLDDAQLAALRPRLQGLPVLSALDLSQTRITDAGLAELHGLTRLRTLILYHNALSAPAVAKLQGALPDCRILYQELAPAEVDAMKVIQRLGGSVTQVEVEGGAVAVDVELSETQITDADLPAIIGAIQAFSQVRAIGVRGAGFSPAGLAQLRSAFPQAQIAP